MSVFVLLATVAPAWADWDPGAFSQRPLDFASVMTPEPITLVLLLIGGFLMLKKR